jgi:hypothetical protein
MSGRKFNDAEIIEVNYHDGNGWQPADPERVYKRLGSRHFVETEFNADRTVTFMGTEYRRAECKETAVS